MNILIAYGVYMVLSGGFTVGTTAIADFLNWQETSSFLNVFSGIGCGTLLVGLIAIPCGFFLQTISNTPPQKAPVLFLLGSTLGSILSVGLGLYSIYLEQPNILSHELFVIGFRFISIMGLFSSPLCLIEGYLRKIQQSKEDATNEDLASPSN